MPEARCLDYRHACKGVTYPTRQCPRRRCTSRVRVEFLQPCMALGPMTFKKHTTQSLTSFRSESNAQAPEQVVSHVKREYVVRHSVPYCTANVNRRCGSIVENQPAKRIYNATDSLQCCLQQCALETTINLYDLVLPTYWVQKAGTV